MLSQTSGEPQTASSKGSRVTIFFYSGDKSLHFFATAQHTAFPTILILSKHNHTQSCGTLQVDKYNNKFIQKPIISINSIIR